MSESGKLGIGIPCFSASNAAKLVDSANDIHATLAAMCSSVTMTNDFTEKRFIGLTRPRSAAAGESARCCGLKRFNHMEAEQYAGQPSAASFG